MSRGGGGGILVVCDPRERNALSRGRDRGGVRAGFSPAAVGFLSIASRSSSVAPRWRVRWRTRSHALVWCAMVLSAGALGCQILGIASFAMRVLFTSNRRGGGGPLSVRVGTRVGLGVRALDGGEWKHAWVVRGPDARSACVPRVGRGLSRSGRVLSQSSLLSRFSPYAFSFLLATTNEAWAHCGAPRSDTIPRLRLPRRTFARVVGLLRARRGRGLIVRPGGRRLRQARRWLFGHFLFVGLPLLRR